jgi:hypothetical protein
MADGYMIANLGRGRPAGDMDDTTILDISPASDFYPIDIAPQDGIKPDRAFGADSNIADYHAIGSQKAALGYPGAFPVIGDDHNL